MSIERKRALLRAALFGAISVGLYILLYLFSDQILAYSKEGRWFFVIPIGIAFLFSIVHGNFTGQFWDLIGVKAKTTKK
jgi:hypothetical protein